MESIAKSPIFLLRFQEGANHARERTIRRVFWLLLAVVIGAGAWHGYMIDLPMYTRAASKVLSGDLANLHELHTNEAPKFHYSYFFALLFVPFTLFGPAAARVLLCAAIALAYLLILRLTLKLVSEQMTPRGFEGAGYSIALITVLLSIYAFNDVFMSANIAIFLLLLSLGAFWAHTRLPWLAGLLLGAAIVIKVYPLMLVGYFIWAKRFRVVLWTLIFALTFYVVVPSIFEGPAMAVHLLRTQTQALAAFGSHWPLDCIWFQSWPATMMRYASLADVKSPWVFRGAMIAGLLAMVMFYLPGFLRPASSVTESTRMRMFFLALGATPLLLPVSWYNVGVFYIPICAHFAALWVKERSRWAIAALIPFAALYCLTTPDLVGKSFNDTLEFFSIPFLGALWLVLAYAGDTFRRHTPDFV